jgi:hypothetical protein
MSSVHTNQALVCEGEFQVKKSLKKKVRCEPRNVFRR